MMTIAVTGGVACGKSLFCESLVERLTPDRCRWFSCDLVVSDLLERREVQDEIRAWESGEKLFSGEILLRTSLRKQVFENPDFRVKLEGLLHPLVLERAEAFRIDLSGQRCIALLEVPLLYEVEFPVTRDRELVVAASRATQIRRIIEHRNLSRELIEPILDSQLPIETKMARGDLVVWNEGSEDLFQAQIQHLANRCQLYLENDR